MTQSNVYQKENNTVTFQIKTESSSADCSDVYLEENYHILLKN